MDQTTRRTFLAGATIGMGASLIAANTAGAQAAAQSPRPTGAPQPDLEKQPPLPPAERVGFAVIGLGDFAQAQMIPALGRTRRAKLTAVVSGNADKARRVAANHGVPARSIYSYDTMGQLSRNRDVEVAYIVTPNSTHADLTVRALEAGKHVLCEKPMANSPAECQRMIDAAKAAGRKLMIAYRAHWEPHNVRVKEMIDAGELGKIWFASSDHHRPLDLSKPRDQWRAKKAIAGGGSFVDIGVYSLNGLIWLMGEVPNAVSASAFSPPGDPRFAEVENVLVAELAFPSGARATISSGYTADKKRIDLWGDKLVATLDPATSYSGNRLTVSNSTKAEEVVPKGSDADQFTGELDHIAEVVRNGGDIRTPGEMGLRDVRIIEALYRSAAERRWIDLNPDGSMKG